MTVINGQKCCLSGCFRVLPVSEFRHEKRSPDGYAARCRGCEKGRLARRRHGLTSDDRARIAERQDGCALCSRTEPGRKGWVVDHDHSCCPGDTSCATCRRGLLCQWCNNALGYAGDDPAVLRRMADYLSLGTRLAPLTDASESVQRVSPARGRPDSHGRTNTTD